MVLARLSEQFRSRRFLSIRLGYQRGAGRQGVAWYSNQGHIPLLLLRINAQVLHPSS